MQIVLKLCVSGVWLVYLCRNDVVLCVASCNTREDADDYAHALSLVTGAVVKKSIIEEGY